jgi:predicted MFS family arabinose efflux permease
MIALTIVLGIAALVTAYSVGITQTWAGTAATSAVVLLLVVAALPSAWWLFDSLAGWATAAALWAGCTALYHALLHVPAPVVTDQRRQTPVVELRRRHVIGWQMGRYQVGIAVGVTA